MCWFGWNVVKQSVNSPSKVIGFQVQSWVSRPGQLAPRPWSLGPAPVPLSDPGRSPLPVPLWAHSPASGLHAQTLVSRAPAAASSRSGVLSSLHCPRHPASAQGVTPSSWAPECLNPALPHTFLQHQHPACRSRDVFGLTHPTLPASGPGTVPGGGASAPVHLFFTGLQL